MPGGARLPSIPKELAAWRTLRRVKAGELGPPVAACSACGQPMFCTEGELPPIERWEFPLPEGSVFVGADGCSIEADDDEVDRKVEEHYRPVQAETEAAGAVGFALVLLAMSAMLATCLGAFECPSMATAAVISGVAVGGRKYRNTTKSE